MIKKIFIMLFLFISFGISNICANYENYIGNIEDTKVFISSSGTLNNQINLNYSNLFGSGSKIIVPENFSFSYIKSLGIHKNVFLYMVNFNNEIQFGTCVFNYNTFLFNTCRINLDIKNKSIQNGLNVNMYLNNNEFDVNYFYNSNLNINFIESLKPKKTNMTPEQNIFNYGLSLLNFLVVLFLYLIPIILAYYSAKNNYLINKTKKIYSNIKKND